jgi:hypothetical protein
MLFARNNGMVTIVRDDSGTAHLITKRGMFPESDCGSHFNGGERVEEINVCSRDHQDHWRRNVHCGLGTRETTGRTCQ